MYCELVRSIKFGGRSCRKRIKIHQNRTISHPHEPYKNPSFPPPTLFILQTRSSTSPLPQQIGVSSIVKLHCREWLQRAPQRSLSSSHSTSSSFPCPVHGPLRSRRRALPALALGMPWSWASAPTSLAASSTSRSGHLLRSPAAVSSRGSPTLRLPSASAPQSRRTCSGSTSISRSHSACSSTYARRRSRRVSSVLKRIMNDSAEVYIICWWFQVVSYCVCRKPGVSLTWLALASQRCCCVQIYLGAVLSQSISVQ